MLVDRLPLDRIRRLLLLVATALGLVAGGLLVVAGGVLGFAGARPGNIDDAFITMVYGRHLAESGRLYWNAADGTLDGFTSLIDVVVKAVAFALHGDPIEAVWWTTFAWHLAVGLVVFVLGLLWVQAHRVPWRGAAIALLAGLVVATSPALANGSSYLLETPLFVLAVLVAGAPLIAGRDAPPGRAGLIAWTVLLVLLPLIRPEGLVVSPVLIGLHTWRRRRQIPLRPLLLPAAAFVGAMGIYFLWRVLVFGHWAPNTYYAKTSALRTNEILDGLDYLLGFAKRFATLGPLKLAVIALGPALALLRQWPAGTARRTYLLISCSALGMLLVVVYAGGDCYPGGRFLALPLVLSWLALLHAALHLAPRVHLVPLGLLGAFALAHAIQIGIELKPKLAAIKHGWPLREESFACTRHISRTLGRLAGKDPIAHSDYQRLKYFSDETHLVGLYGLNTRWIAHKPLTRRVKWGKYSHANGIAVDAPIWIYGYRVPLSPMPMAAVPLRQLLSPGKVADAFVGWHAAGEEARQIKARYLPASIPACNGRYFNFLVHRGRAMDFRLAGVLVGQR